jgi:hypothetical protein
MPVNASSSDKSPCPEIELVSINTIRPAPENSLLYRPVHPNNPDVVELARSIAEHGLLQPIDLTADDMVISGHRRLAAHRRLGRPHIAARRHDLLSDDPRLIPLIREFNRQRVKSFAEILAEAALDAGHAAADPVAARAALVRHRRERVHLDENVGQEVEVGTRRKRSKISTATRPLLDAVLGILNDLREHWPLTDRQVHYKLLNDPPLLHAAKPGSRYRNDQKCYKRLTDLLTRARIEGLISWAALDDPTRPRTDWRVWPDVGRYLDDELSHNLLRRYARDLQRSQPCHIEIVAEKLTVRKLVDEVAMDYHIPTLIGRGFSSIPPRKDLVCRFARSGKEKLVLLFLTDFDPEGENIPQSFVASLVEDFGLDRKRIHAVKVGLTHEQVAGLNLPQALEAKKGSSRYKAFVRRYGDHVHELEAVSPEILQGYVRTGIEAVLDRELFEAEVRQEGQEAVQLEQVRNRVIAAIRSVGGLGD